ncbi:MAG: hypothetical protein GY713_19485 [Actinomycetia bacterium]|nr:hypothetical protein [Actinomycetes bacterium]MCP3913122.1 hypothetical protein [Actinomycetes bacterium]
MLALDLSLSDSLQQSLDDLGAFLPKLIGAIVIFLVGWFIARVIQRVLHAALTRLNVDALVDRSGLGGPLERAGYADSGLLLARIVYWGLMLIVLQLTFDTLNITEVNDVLDDFVAFVPRLLVAIIILFVVGALANWLRELLSGVTSEFEWGNLVTNVGVAGVWLIGVFAALDQLKIAENIVQTTFTIFMGSIGAIVVIKFGVGGIWAARDRFWPAVYDRVGSATRSTTPSSQD